MVKKDVACQTFGMLFLQESHWVGCSFGLSIPVSEKTKVKKFFKTHNIKKWVNTLTETLRGIHESMRLAL